MWYVRAFLLTVVMPIFLTPTVRAIEWQTVLTDNAIPGWEPKVGAAEDSWIVKDGVLICTGKAVGRDGTISDWGRAWIGTKADYTDFMLDFEFKLSPGGNSGVFLRAPAPPADGRPSHEEGHPSYHGMEIQLLDDYADKYKKLPTPANYCGSLYLIAAPAERVTKPAGQWNHMRVTADRDHIVVELNGQKIVDADGKSHPEILKRSRRGPVGFQNHGTPLWFRNVKLANLAKDRAKGADGKAEACKQRMPGKMVFSHIGIVTTEKKPDERFVPATRVWVTDFQNHPYHVEWLRYEPDSPVSGPVREMPHVAYQVDSIKAAAKGMKELLAPFDAGIAVVGFYQTDDGAVVEFMEMKEQK